VLAFFVNRPDIHADAAGLSLRPGFDVSDRIFYATVAQELGRAPIAAIQNPVFAGLPLQYAFLPCLLGLLLGVSTGTPLVVVFVLHVPVVGLFWVGAAVLGFLQELGVSRRARWLSATLVVLGGDLSFLLPPSPVPFDRFGRFFTFFSFSAESLFYNPWMFGVPLTLAALLAGRRFLSGARRGDLLVTTLLLAGLWQTKAFGFAALAGAALLAGAGLRCRRLLALAASALAAAVPLVFWAVETGGGREGAPLHLSPLFLVKSALANNGALAALGDRVGLLGAMPVFLAGGLGVRLLGVPGLLARARSDSTGFVGWVAWAIGVMIAAALLLEGNPTAIEAVQFLLLAQSLLWLFAGPVLDAVLAQRPALGVLLLAMALASPVGYLARKALPEIVPSAGPLDGAWVRLTPDALAACRFLERSSAPTDRVLVPVAGRDPASGARGLALAAVAGRRVPAIAAPFHVSRENAGARIGAVSRVYETEEASEAEGLIDRLGVDWVLEEAEQPLRFRSDRLSVAFVSGGVRVHRVVR
jgi:hypothetical protein